MEELLEYLGSDTELAGNHAKEDAILENVVLYFEPPVTARSCSTFVPGSFYATPPTTFTQEKADELFEKLISTTGFLKRNAGKVAVILSHIAGYNFPYFIEKHAPRLFDAQNTTLLNVTVQVCRIILDPTTGFLRNAPFSPLNGTWEDDQRFDFFSAESPCLQTPFGQALVRFREMVHLHIVNNYSEFLEGKGTAEFAVFVPSALAFVQSIVVPPTFRLYDVACGFPTRVEILLLFSKFQDRHIYTKKKDPSVNDAKLAHVEEWTKSLRDWDDEEMKAVQTAEVSFPDAVPCSNPLDVKFLKLILFLNVDRSTFVDYYLKLSIMPIILGNDVDRAAFMIFWTQVLLFVLPEFSFKLFDDIFALFNKLHEMSYSQFFTYLHAIARFVDVLSLLPTRYIDDEHMQILTSIAIAGMISPQVRVRTAGYKLARVMGNFESEGKSALLISLIQENEMRIQQMIYDRFERSYNISSEDSNKKRLITLTFGDALLTSDLSICETLIAGFAACSMDLFPYDFIVSEKKRWYADLQESKRAQSVDVERLLLSLTYLAPLADFPFIFKDSEDFTRSLELSEHIITELVEAVQTHWKTHVVLIRNMLVAVNVSSFPVIIKTLEAMNPEPRVVAIVLRALSWNVNFSAVSEHKEFFLKFLDLFGHTFSELAKECDITTVTKDDQEIAIPEHLVPFCIDLLVSFYMILSVMIRSNTRNVESPFPCCYLVDSTSNEAFQRTLKHFAPLWNLSKGRNVPAKVKLVAIRTLELWTCCNAVPNLQIFCNDVFLAQLNEISKQRPQILLFLLSHHFDMLFSHYIQASYTENNEQYFGAIAAFFRSEPIGATITPAAVLSEQYMSCSDNCSDQIISQYLSVIYENCGSLILVCLFYLSRAVDKTLTEQAFMVLGSLAPVLSLYHMNGRRDNVTKIVDIFFKTCNNIGQNLSCISVQDICQISTVLCDCFQFCMEQLIYDACSYIPKRNHLETDRMLMILNPWFKAVELDTENRVISKETDLLFMKFSCFTFVDTLMFAFSDTTADDINSQLFNTWKTLITTSGVPNNNFLSVFLSVIYSSYAIRNHAAAQVIIHYIFRITPQLTSDILAAFLSFGFAIHCYFGNAEGETSDEASSEAYDSEEDTGLVRSRMNLVVFLLNVLNQLVLDSVRPFLRSLPTILVHCMIYLDKFGEKATTLIQNIMMELMPLVGAQCVPYIQNVLFLCTSADAVEDTTNSHEFLVQLSRSITDFLLVLDPKMAKQMGLELLQWGLCYGDTVRAARAIACYRGNMSFSDTLVVGLTARVLWYVTDALRIIPADESTDCRASYYIYIAEHLRNLRCIAESFQENGTLGTDSALLWIAVESMKCNTKSTQVIFEAALELFQFIVSSPNIFHFLAVGKDYATQMLTTGIFTKFHQPWGDVFHGVAPYIYECKVENVDIEFLIRVLNLTVQTGYLPLWSDSKSCPYMVLLSLLPWMWSVVITDVSRFIYDSPAVQMMEATHAALSTAIDSQDIIENLGYLTSPEDVDIFMAMTKLCSIIVPAVSTDELIMIGKFFTTCLKHGNKYMRSPLYSIVTNIIKFAAEKQRFIDSIGEFIDLVKKDKNESRKSYKQLFHEVCGVVEDSPLCAVVEEPVVPFPEMEMFERIVAVNIPHMYELNSSELDSINIEDLNSFPPWMPFESSVLSSERFAMLNEVLRQFRFEPFVSWTELTNKLHTSLIDTDELEVMKKKVDIKSLHVHTVLSEVMKNIDVKTRLDETDFDVASQEQVAPVDLEEKPEEEKQDKDPYAFVFMEPLTFVPSVDEINLIGNELFEDPGAFQDEMSMY